MTTPTDNEKQCSFSLKKDERLCSKKLIEQLFAKGESFLAYPLKVVFLETTLETKFPAQAAFTVSKKNFKRAVKRNRIKRLMRESYRLNKNPLYITLGNRQLAIFFIFIGKELPVFSRVESAMKKAITKLTSQLEAKEN